MNSLYKKKLLPYLAICLMTIITSLIIWMPFIVKSTNIGNIKLPISGFETVKSNWDGPLYIIVAKTWYNPNHSIFNEPPLGLSPSYYPAHLPLYPLTIMSLSKVFTYPNAMLASTVIASMILFCIFYYFTKKHKLTNRPFLLVSVFMFWPRLLVVRSVGSPEPLFLTLIIASLFLFYEKKYLYASILGALAVATKTPGILLFGAYVFYLLNDYRKSREVSLKSFSIMLIPLGLVSVFQLYNIQLKDFFAYYHTNAVVPMSGFFSMFNAGAKWVGTAWLEDVIFILLLLSVGTVSAFYSQKKTAFSPRGVMFIFMLTFLVSLVTVEHRDISRYSLPVIPLLFITFEKIVTDKRFIIGALCMLPAIFLYAINFIASNAAPITHWQAFF